MKNIFKSVAIKLSTKFWRVKKCTDASMKAECLFFPPMMKTKMMIGVSKKALGLNRQPLPIFGLNYPKEVDIMKVI